MALRFENLKRQDRLQAIDVLKSNAEVLFDTADYAAQKGNYGLARSLLIYGSVEFIKAIILYLKSISVQVFKIKEVRIAVNGHKNGMK